MRSRLFILLMALLTQRTFAEQATGFSGCHVQGALDPQGRIHLVYANAEWNDLYHRVFQDGVWSEPTCLANSSPMWLLFCYPSLAIGSDGIPQVVYGRETGNYPNDLELFTFAKATDVACTSWTYQTIGYDGYRRSQADIALDENNQPHIAYHLTNKYQPWWYRIIYRRPDGSEVIIRHKDHPQRCTRPRIAYMNGVVHIVWYETTGNSVNVFHASGTPYGSFSVSQVSNVGSGRYVESPAVAVHPNGTPQIVYLVSDWNGAHPVYVGLYRTQPGWTDGVLLESITCSLNEADEDFMPPSIAFDSAGNRYVGWGHHTLNRHYCKKNDEPRMEFSPFGHIDVWTYGQNAYYARTGNPGPIYWHQLAGSGANTPPSITMLTPPSAGAEADASYTLSWTDSDPDDNATIALFYDTDSSGFDGVPIPGAQSIQEDPDGTGDQFAWNISSLPDDARYWVYATINDGTNPVARSYAPGSLFVNHVNDAPWITLTAPSGADTAQGGAYRVSWTDGDPDDDASISLFYSPVGAPGESTLIVQGLSEDDAANFHDWNVSSVPPGTYRIYARITDGALDGYSHSAGTVTTLARATFSPTDDASVYRDWEPSLPHGDRPDLDVGADDLGVPDEMAFFRFEVTGLQYGIVHAYLRVHCVDEGGGGGVHAVASTAWTEENLTWNNMPGIGGSPASTIPWVYAGTWYAYEVTSLMIGNGVHAFALRSTVPNGAHFASKEYGTASLRPYLEVLMSGTVPELPPTAQVDSILPNPVIQGFHQTVGFWGRGWDNDEGGASIVAWQWSSSLNGPIGASATFTLPPTSLSVGTHVITLTVQDDEGVWSSPDTASLEVRPPDSSPPTWPNGTGILAAVDLADGGSVRLFWNAATDENPPVGYNVYHNDSSPAFSGTCLGSVAWTPGVDYSCMYVVANLPVGVPRYFGVRAVDVVGNEDGNTAEIMCIPTVSVTTYSCLPTDDAYVSSAEPDANFGASTLLLVGAGQIVYLRFQVPDVGEVVDAKLRLVAAASLDTATVYPVASTTWEEETLTWNTRPFVGGTSLDGLMSLNPAQACTVDLAAYVTAPGPYSMALNSPSSRGGAFYSKEHTVESQRPMLIVWYQGDLVAPSAPRDLSCTAVGSDVLLSWQPATDNVGVSGYRIFRGWTPYFDPSPRLCIGTTQATQFTDIEALGDPDIDHYYVVTAFDAAENESIPSNRAGERESEVIDP